VRSTGKEEGPDWQVAAATIKRIKYCVSKSSLRSADGVLLLKTEVVNTNLCSTLWWEGDTGV